MDNRKLESTTIPVPPATEKFPNRFLAVEILALIKKQAKANPDSVEGRLRTSLRSPIADYLACGNFADDAAIRRAISDLTQVHPWILRSKKYSAKNETHTRKVIVTP